MKIKGIKVTIETDKGNKSFMLNETSAPIKNDKGKVSKAHYQPTSENKVIMQYGKVYIDTVELDKELKVK